MTPEEKREYMRQYRIDNKEKLKEYHRQYTIDHKDKRKEYNEKNKERDKDYKKVWNQSPVGIKTSRLSKWKRSGVIHDDFDELYEKYINTEFCELCNVELTVDKAITKTTRCLDHDHTTGLFRNVVCNSCNVRLPRQ